MAFGAVAAWLVALTVYDLRYRRLPNLLTLPGGAAVVVGAALSGRGVAALLGALLLVAVYAAVHLAAPGALGAGDVKLAIGVGALTGAFGMQAWALCAVGASLITGTWGFARMLRGLRSPVPHGPSMCLAAVVAVAGALPAG
ncbi:prepilin peptidase [Mycolicibacterium sp. 018/SC-01/001]|uniref:prepilin peptidase n=1 Tax=Mycolicibacterium sp. 018/SC-01/001 TaxID=2592069 RepID=UPI0011811E02|nr:A24 family peptidase [Mycolicibacterium sp. 018/SC-01/001]TRW84956.1 prepilin peptidase [Mycolicibacterium sp. 018/SC-01/001]